MSFRKLTKQQREIYHALRELGGEMVVTPSTARQLSALASRGIVRYRHDYGARLAVLKPSKATRRLNARTTRKLRDGESAYQALTAGVAPWIPGVEVLK